MKLEIIIIDNLSLQGKKRFKFPCHELEKIVPNIYPMSFRGKKKGTFLIVVSKKTTYLYEKYSVKYNKT